MSRQNCSSPRPNGEIIRLEEGRHRVSIAKILDINPIPVVVVMRHKKWQQIRSEFENANKMNEVAPEFRQYKDHPDIVCQK